MEGKEKVGSYGHFKEQLSLLEGSMWNGWRVETHARGVHVGRQACMDL